MRLLLICYLTFCTTGLYAQELDPNYCAIANFISHDKLVKKKIRKSFYFMAVGFKVSNQLLPTKSNINRDSIQYVDELTACVKRQNSSFTLFFVQPKGKKYYAYLKWTGKRSRDFELYDKVLKLIFEVDDKYNVVFNHADLRMYE